MALAAWWCGVEEVGAGDMRAKHRAPLPRKGFLSWKVQLNPGSHRIQWRNRAASLSPSPVLGLWTRPTCSSTCPWECWECQFFKNKTPRRTMQSGFFAWMLQICLIETSAGAQTCCWIITSTLKNRAGEPFDGVIVITWHKYSFKESEQSKWHFRL